MKGETTKTWTFFLFYFFYFYCFILNFFYIYISLLQLYLSKKTMDYYQTILDDLMNGLPAEVNKYPVPYEEWMTFEDKFKVTRKALFRAKSTNNRLLQLVNAFYLGQLLEEGADSND